MIAYIYVATLVIVALTYGFGVGYILKRYGAEDKNSEHGYRLFSTFTFVAVAIIAGTLRVAGVV